ncbi:MAG: hypothetical protein HGA63_06470 [Syntrophobacteraceae bacterium]|nr:hypothetical protein [Syntrophobacteraceae bacterium]
MITNKEDEQKDRRVGLDMEAFEMQVDQEIDSLFVPGNAVEGADENASDVQMVDDVEIQVVGESSPEASADPVFAEENVDTAAKGMDVSAFEVQIDKEIDNLFVPADFGDVPMDQSSFGAAGQETEVLGALEVEAVAAQAAGEQAEPPPLRLELEVPEGEPAVYASQEKAPVPDKEKLPDFSTEGLAGLLALMVVSGATVSTVQLAVVGVSCHSPELSFPKTYTVYSPSPR